MSCKIEYSLYYLSLHFCEAVYSISIEINFKIGRNLYSNRKLAKSISHSLNIGGKTLVAEEIMEAYLFFKVNLNNVVL